MPKPLNLDIAMLPGPLHRASVRHFVSWRQWKKFKDALVAERGAQCATCGKEGVRLHLHEEWAYDTRSTPAVARIVGTNLLCFHCHMCGHIGFLHNVALSGELPNALEDTIRHFCSVNGVRREVFHRRAGAAERDAERLSKLNWVVIANLAPLLIAVFDRPATLREPTLGEKVEFVLRTEAERKRRAVERAKAKVPRIEEKLRSVRARIRALKRATRRTPSKRRKRF